MLKSLVLIACILASLSSCAQDTVFHVSVHIEDMPDQDVYLDYYIHGKKVRLKSHSSGGKFHFSDSVPEPTFANIHHELGLGEIELFLDNSKWNVVGTYDKFNDAQVDGSLIDKQWKQYFFEDQELIRKTFDAPPTSVIDDSKIKSNPDLQNKRKLLLKSCVRQFRDSHAGALIPTFCTIEKSLTIEDWAEIFETLTPEIRSTWYGRKIKAKVERRFFE
ncbi:MAG TPA: DUF4369 domain-containing protein [Chryseosolibacter sp.]